MKRQRKFMLRFHCRNIIQGTNEKSMNGVFIVTVSVPIILQIVLLMVPISLSIIRIPLSMIHFPSFVFFHVALWSGRTEKGMTVPKLLYQLVLCCQLSSKIEFYQSVISRTSNVKRELKNEQRRLYVLYFKRNCRRSS